MIPDVLEIKDPPIIVINKKYKLRLFDFIKVIPEFVRLLMTLIIKSRPLLSLKYTNKINMTMENVDEYCEGKMFFMPIYNSAPGFPRWFLDLSEKEILNSTLLISKHLKQALGV